MLTHFLLCCLQAMSVTALGEGERVSKQWDVSLSPERLTCRGRETISVTCSVSNLSQDNLNVLLDSADVFLWPNLVVVKTYGWKTAELERITVRPGESRQFLVELKLGRDVPALDSGQYRFRVDLCVETEGVESYTEREANVVVRQTKRDEGDGDLWPSDTAQAILNAARRYSEEHAGNDPQILDYNSYQIRRYRSDWDVSFSYQGPKHFGVRVVSVNAVTKRPYFRPIP